jgi:hypothetical protein
MPETAQDQRRTALEAFSRALDREAHIFPTADLECLPQLIFQQLYNRLQWHVTDGETAERITKEVDRRSARARESPRR